MVSGPIVEANIAGDVTVTCNRFPVDSADEPLSTRDTYGVTSVMAS